MLLSETRLTKQTLLFIVAEMPMFVQNELIDKCEPLGLVWLISFPFVTELDLLMFWGLFRALKFLRLMRL